VRARAIAPPRIEEDRHMETLKQIADQLERGNVSEVGDLTEQAIGQKLPPKTILDDGLIAGMNVVGEKFKAHEIFLPDVLLAAKAMYAGMDLLKPLLIEEGIPTTGRVVIGTIQGDLHDIGKNLVAILLRGAGFEVIDLGNDVSPEAFVKAAREEKASVIGMSALLTTTMLGMRQVVELVKSEGLGGEVKTIVGGAPLSADFAQEIGADAYAYDGANAVDKVKALVGVAQGPRP
jgi:5-methyltetrahydrofolate--homocysteine methyltransferase